MRSSSLPTRSERSHDAAALLKAATSGDHVAIETLVLLHKTALRGFLCRRVARVEDVDDLSQKTWLRVYKKLNTFQGRASFRTWLLRIADSIVVDHYRAKAVRPADPPPNIELRDSGQLGTAVEMVQSTCDAREQLALCIDCIQHVLTLKQQVVVYLCDVYGFTDREAARLTGQSVGVIKHLLHDARTKLRGAFPTGCGLVEKKGRSQICAGAQAAAKRLRKSLRTSHAVVGKSVPATTDRFVELRDELIAGLR